MPDHRIVHHLLRHRRAWVICALVLVAAAQAPYAQSRPQAPPPQTAPAAPPDPVMRAFNAGQYDEVERLLRGATDMRAVVMRARSDVARGRYAEAEKALAPLATAQPMSDAALELGLLHMYLGKRAEGTRLLRAIVSRLDPRTAADNLRLGLAARAVGDIQDANGFFRQADRMAPGNAVINTAWGDLFLDKGENAEAQKSYQLALKADEQNVAAIIGLARVTVQENPPAARQAIDRALKINPGSVPAHLMIAEMALDNEKRDEARASIASALKTNPNSLEALALDAATAYLEGRRADYDSRAKQAQSLNANYGEFFRVSGEHAARHYRFDEAVDLTRRAVKIDPLNTRASADLGSHLLRTGDEKGARAALETAFKGDSFNSSVVTKNLLELLDTLDTFETITEGDITFRFDPSEVNVMREHALPLAQQALATLSKLYQFEPQGPILIEMFPKHDDFAVRTIGLPGFIGALGACFGRVVTLDSPRARKPGDFSWGETLWHEMAHVITLQMSNNRMPRWLSEGMSVFEERRARPEWGREMELPFAQAMEQGKILKLETISEGFSDPKMISLAYYQSSLIVDHLVETYGEPKLRALLRAYGEGLETDAAMKQAFGVGLSEIQTGFDARIEKQFAGLRRALKTPEIKGKPSLDDLKSLASANPESFVLQMRLAEALHANKDSAGAIEALERASKILPNANGDSNPNRLIASIALERKDNERAIRALEAVMRVDHSDVESARKLAGLVAPLGDAARAENAYRRLVEIDPFDREAQAALGRLALKRKDTVTAIRSFRSVLGSNPPDRATAHADLADALLAAGQFGEAKKQTLAALEIAPSFERAQDLLLKIADTAK
jgi:tetratricopeptide (TPR) repeat protein